MTWVTDNNGTRWVEPQPRKRRRGARNIRFRDLQPGTVLIGQHKSISYVTVPVKPGTANDNAFERIKITSQIVLCEDRWFDPVAGQNDDLAGQMASIRYIFWNGIHGAKRAHTLRGLSQAGYRYATPEQAREALRFVEEVNTLRAAVNAQEITMAEARLRHTPWDVVLRRMGLS